MKRTLCLALLAAAACSDSSKPASQTPATSAPPMPFPGSPGEAPQPPGPVVLDDAMVDKYIAATRSVAQELKAWGGGGNDRAPSGGRIPGDAQRKVLDDASRLVFGKLGELSAAAAAREGLTQAQYQRVAAICDSLLAERKVFDDWGGEEGLAAMEVDVRTQLKERLARLPAKERPRAEASAQADLKKLSDVRALGAATQTRRTFGDADVDRLVKRIRDLRAVRSELSEAMPPIFR